MNSLGTRAAKGELLEGGERRKEVSSFFIGWLSTGCPVLNKTLRGGLLVPGVMEIAGTSAAGKTQLCLQLCLTVQLPRDKGGLEGGEQSFISTSTPPCCRLTPYYRCCVHLYGRCLSPQEASTAGRSICEESQGAGTQCTTLVR